MTMTTVTESGMVFGPLDEEHCFRIEASETYKRVQHKVPIAEFIWLRVQENKPSTILIIEAKSSSPRPETQPDFDSFMSDIQQKWLNTLSLTLALGFGRHPDTNGELPAPFKSLDLAKTDLRFILVINGHQDDWLAPLQESLNKLLHATMKTWRLPPSAVLVLNDVLARERKLIT